MEHMGLDSEVYSQIELLERNLGIRWNSLWDLMDEDQETGDEDWIRQKRRDRWSRYCEYRDWSFDRKRFVVESTGLDGNESLEGEVPFSNDCQTRRSDLDRNRSTWSLSSSRGSS